MTGGFQNQYHVWQVVFKINTIYDRWFSKSIPPMTSGFQNQYHVWQVVFQTNIVYDGWFSKPISSSVTSHLTSRDSVALVHCLLVTQMYTVPSQCQGINMLGSHYSWCEHFNFPSGQTLVTLPAFYKPHHKVSQLVYQHTFPPETLLSRHPHFTSTSVHQR